MITLFPSRIVAIEIFGFSVHWYGLLYLIGFVLMTIVLPRLQHYRELSLQKDEWNDLFFWIVIGVIVGGRLGFVLFYEPAYYGAFPLEIFAVWKGGMSSHGGFIGVGTAIILFAVRRKYPLLALADIAVIPAALGLGLGRIGNLINQELYGRETLFPWGIVIPGVEGLRHPTPIYSSLANILIAGLCYMHLRKTEKSGMTTVLFLILYSISRFFIEFVREPSHSVISFGSVFLTRGQVLTLFLFLGGSILWLIARGKRSCDAES